MTVIRIAAVVLYNSVGQILSVRKQDTSAFMLPGGKIEVGERPVDAVIREVNEELGVCLESHELSFLGRCTAPAANEEGASVDCDVFVWSGVIKNTPAVRAEIVEARWFYSDSRDVLLAPLSRDVVFPLVVGRNLDI